MINSFSGNYLEVVRKRRRNLTARTAEESNNMQSEIINVVYEQNETEKTETTQLHYTLLKNKK